MELEERVALCRSARGADHHRRGGRRSWERVMRNVTLIVVHCSANKAGSALRAADIDRYHRSLGWKGCGYHFVIPADGAVEEGRPLSQVGSHCRGHNSHSIGVCYVGGLDARGNPADTRTEAQRVALRKLLERLHREFPKAVIVGHRDLDSHKACPCFDAVREYLDLEP